MTVKTPTDMVSGPTFASPFNVVGTSASGILNTRYSVISHSIEGSTTGCTKFSPRNLESGRNLKGVKLADGRVIKFHLNLTSILEEREREQRGKKLYKISEFKRRKKGQFAPPSKFHYRLH